MRRNNISTEYHLNADERFALTYYTDRLNDQLREIDLMYNDIHSLRNEVRITRNIINNLMHVGRDRPNSNYSYVMDFIIPVASDFINGSTTTGSTAENSNVGLQTVDFNRNVTQCIFSDINNPINTSCPIQLYNFNANSSVSRINYCGHIFDRNGLNRWFERNTRCPICRYNLITETDTETETETVNHTHNTNGNRNNTLNSTISQIWMDPSLNVLTENILGSFFNRNTSETRNNQPNFNSRRNNTRNNHIRMDDEENI